MEELDCIEQIGSIHYATKVFSLNIFAKIFPLTGDKCLNCHEL